MPEAKFEYTGENLKDKIKVGGSKPDRQTVSQTDTLTDSQTDRRYGDILILLPDPNWTFVPN